MMQRSRSKSFPRCRDQVAKNQATIASLQESCGEGKTADEDEHVPDSTSQDLDASMIERLARHNMRNIDALRKADGDGHLEHVNYEDRLGELR